MTDIYRHVNTVYYTLPLLIMHVICYLYYFLFQCSYFTFRG